LRSLGRPCSTALSFALPEQNASKREVLRQRPSAGEGTFSGAGGRRAKQFVRPSTGERRGVSPARVASTTGGPLHRARSPLRTSLALSGFWGSAWGTGHVRASPAGAARASTSLRPPPAIPPRARSTSRSARPRRNPAFSPEQRRRFVGRPFAKHRRRVGAQQFLARLPRRRAVVAEEANRPSPESTPPGVDQGPKPLGRLTKIAVPLGVGPGSA